MESLEIRATYSGILSTWHVAIGDKVYRSQKLAVLTGIAGAVKPDGDVKLVNIHAPRNGTLAELRVVAGCLVTAEDVICTLDWCRHSVVYHGMCADCGEDLTTGHFAEVSSGEQRLSVAYAPSSLSVTIDEARHIEANNARRLLNEKKLTLVLDLDHTLLHATNLAWAHEAFQLSNTLSSDMKGSLMSPRASKHHRGVHFFHLPGSPLPMFIKLRPGLGEFLIRMVNLFELHIYTMGSRPYADLVAKLIDPQRILFRGRITSRDDFPEGRLNQKNLRRLFPCDDSMVLIVDDREDVWLDARSTSVPNLVRARPYAFFSAVGEVFGNQDSVELPHAERLGHIQQNTKQSSSSTSEMNEEATGGNTDMTLSDKTELSKQSEMILEAWSKYDSGDKDHLRRLAEILEECHGKFYMEVDRIGDFSLKTDQSSFSVPADVKKIMSCMRRQVLENCVISFSGVFPKNGRPEACQLWKTASSLGANLSDGISETLTHLVVDEIRGKDTEKTAAVKHREDVFIVSPRWIENCAETLCRENETDYLIFPEQVESSGLSREEWNQQVRSNQQKGRDLHSAPSHPPPTKRMRRLTEEEVDDMERELTAAIDVETHDGTHG
mmetsp:Transcript_18592/g.39057  ORF Transcript_18592/g.39057 Transcript_18592/m.39057 type:complete len:609 (-) Transcript_18592:372-2198(-)